MHKAAPLHGARFEDPPDASGWDNDWLDDLEEHMLSGIGGRRSGARPRMGGGDGGADAGDAFPPPKKPPEGTIITPDTSYLTPRMIPGKDEPGLRREEIRDNLDKYLEKTGLRLAYDVYTEFLNRIPGPYKKNMESFLPLKKKYLLEEKRDETGLWGLRIYSLYRTICDDPDSEGARRWVKAKRGTLVQKFRKSKTTDYRKEAVFMDTYDNIDTPLNPGSRKRRVKYLEYLFEQGRKDRNILASVLSVTCSNRVIFYTLDKDYLAFANEICKLSDGRLEVRKE